MSVWCRSESIGRGAGQAFHLADHAGPRVDPSASSTTTCAPVTACSACTKLEQLTKFSLHPEKKQTISIFASNIEAAVKDALALRKQLRETPIRDIRDVQYMERLDQEARQKLEHIEHIADAMIGEALASGGNQRALDTAMDNLSTWAAAYIEGDNETGRKIIAEARKSLSIDLPAGKPPRKPFSLGT